MPTKVGLVVSFGRRGPNFTEVHLHDGKRVELSPQAMADLRAHDLNEALVFVERRGGLFNYVQWLGTPEEAVQALEDGILRPNEIPAEIQVIGRYFQRNISALNSASADAQRVTQEPWFVDSEIDMDDVQRRLAETGKVALDPVDIVPNPYFVLPLEKLVQWGFSTPEEILAAARWAGSTTPPIRWQNPQLVHLLHTMGRAQTEAFARIGLFFWHLPPSPDSARLNEKAVAEGHIYDVSPPGNRLAAIRQVRFLEGGPAASGTATCNSSI